MIACLRQFYCLSALPEEALRRLSQGARRRGLAAGEPLFSEGEKVKWLWMIRSGSVKLLKTSPEGRKLVVMVMREGELLGCESLLGQRYLLEAVSEGVSEVVVIPASMFKEVFLKEMGAAGMRLLQVLSCCVRQMLWLVEDLAFRDVQMRILCRLYEMGTCREEGPLVFLNFTHQDIASMVGSVREVVSRAMSKLKREGVIVDSTVKGFRVDLRRLEELLSEKGLSPGSAQLQW